MIIRLLQRNYFEDFNFYFSIYKKGNLANLKKKIYIKLYKNMFLQSQKDIQQQRVEHHDNLALRSLKPKLITSLNYEQQYLLRRKQKRNNRRKSSRTKSINSNFELSYLQNTNGVYEDQNQQCTQIQNNFYKQVYDGNDKVSGYWVNGLLQGQAEIQYQNGDYFKGRFEKGYKTQGLMKFKDQGTYEGGFYNQQFHGRGVLRLKQKAISAQWVHGFVQSNCVLQYKNGNVYYGPLKDFKKHGYGYLYFPNDTKFFGQFMQGQVKGYGQFYQKGKLKCKGLWKNGKLIQQKKQQEWSYNFDQENINWQLIEQLFQSKLNNKLLNVFELGNLNSRVFSQCPEAEQFSQRLNKRKNSKNQLSKASSNSISQSSQISNNQILQNSNIPKKNNGIGLLGMLFNWSSTTQQSKPIKRQEKYKISDNILNKKDEIDQESDNQQQQQQKKQQQQCQRQKGKK